MVCNCEEMGSETENEKVTYFGWEEVTISFDEVCCECGKLKKSHINIPYKCMREI